MLSQHSKLFSGKLGCYPKCKFKIEPTAMPYHCDRPYPVPLSHYEVLRKELERQVEIGVLARCYESDWGMPLFAIPKKDGAIRTVDDFRELNKQVVRKKYLLPCIQDIFHRRKNYAFLTVLDLTLGYYTYRLEEESTWYCILVTPFGKFRRLRLPMGMTQSPDWAQGALEEVLHDLLIKFVEAFIDDVSCFTPREGYTDHFDHHLNLLHDVLTRLEENGYQINPQKCKWFVQECELLGHWITPTGIKPLPKKIQGMLAVAPPKTLKELRGFLSLVNFYREHWRHRAHTMAPLSSLTKVPRNLFRSHWTQKHLEAFRAIKAMIATDVLLTYPDPNKVFVIETDASELQLGAVIYQEEKPIAFFSRKLNPAQQRYPASDKEALCIQEVLQEYRSILYGSEIIIRTDHKNLTQRDLKSRRLLHWRLLVEEFAPKFEYLPGPKNVVADQLSRLPLSPLEEKLDLTSLHSKLHECLMYYPNDIHVFPLSFPRVREAQQTDPVILALLQQGIYAVENFANVDLITHHVNGRRKIVLPAALHDDAIAWYHLVLGHVGSNRLIQTLTAFFYIPDLQSKVNEYISKCDSCQRNKAQARGYGHLPPRVDISIPWEEIAIDTIGPWTLDVPGVGRLQIKALTVVDTCTTLSELVRVENGTAAHAGFKLEQCWLSRYPRPLRCIHDPGLEFVGADFQAILHQLDIQPVPTTVKNPQANAICERMHKTVGDMLRTYLREAPPTNIASAYDAIDSVLAAAQRALRTCVHRTFGVSPGTLVFHRDMLLPIPVAADYEMIRARRQAVIDDNARRANSRRFFKDYNVGDEVLLHQYKPAKMQERATGPFPVTQVHVNGTVTIQRSQNVFERVNVRRIRPYNR